MVMHTFIHSPHLTHRFRNSFSSREPGGLRSLGLGTPVFKSGVVFNKGTATTPASIEVTTRRLPRSSAAADFFPENPKLTAFFGHISSQFRQQQHSASFHSSFLSGAAPPWQTEAHAPHELHSSLTDLLSRENLENTPSRAPSGQYHIETSLMI